MELIDDRILHRDIITSEGNDLHTYSFEKPVVLVFLRHFGCNFCREALSNISKIQDTIIDEGFRIIYVHMSDDQTANTYFKKFKIKNPEYISDPSLSLYQHFGLTNGDFNQLFGFKNWSSGFSTILKHGANLRLSDGLQMPGVFIIFEGEIKSKFVHKIVSDQPDYLELIKCCIRI